MTTRICKTCNNPLTDHRQFDYCSTACYRIARRNRPYNVLAMARRLSMPPSTLRNWIQAGRFVWNTDGMGGTILPPPPRTPRTLLPYQHRPGPPIPCPRCHQIGPRAGKRPICWTCDQALTAQGMRFCLAGCHDAAPDAFTPRHGSCRSCMAAQPRPVAPVNHCRVCGCRGISVPLVEIPQDAGGGHLCRLCLVEGLKRAA